MTEKKNEAKDRRRKWAPKARTGCRTCKTRHVKCDEARPVCRRCVLSGFRCDGYPSIPAKDEDDSSPSAEETPKIDGSGTPDTVSSLTVASAQSDTTIAPYRSSSTVTPLVLLPTEPYVDTERHSLKVFVNLTAAMISRSKAAPHFWQTLVPRAAWSFPSVKHAMLAAAISCESLVKRERVYSGRKQSDLQVLTHTQKAVQSVLQNDVPLDVVLLTSAVLGILGFFNGQWETACTHVTSGAKLASQARQDPHHDPYISFYCEAFGNSLPGILKPAEGKASTASPEQNNLVRLKEAIKSLQLAIAEFDEAMAKVGNFHGPDRDRIMYLLETAKKESGWILRRWQALLQEEKGNSPPPDDDSSINIHRIESPWSGVMAGLNAYLDSGGEATGFDIEVFEVGMGRTMPFYLLAKSGPNLKMREDAVQMMYLGSQMRRRSTYVQEGSPLEPRITAVLDDDEG